MQIYANLMPNSTNIQSTYLQRRLNGQRHTNRVNTRYRDTVANLGVCLYVALYYNLVREKNIYDPQNV